jgi:hypothetical protein
MPTRRGQLVLRPPGGRLAPFEQNNPGRHRHRGDVARHLQPAEPVSSARWRRRRTARARAVRRHRQWREPAPQIVVFWVTDRGFASEATGGSCGVRRGGAPGAVAPGAVRGGSPGRASRALSPPRGCSARGSRRAWRTRSAERGAERGCCRIRLYRIKAPASGGRLGLATPAPLGSLPLPPARSRPA